MKGRRKFFVEGSLLTVVGLLMRSSQLLFGAYISRTVGAEGIGLHTLIMTVFAFAVTFATSGVSLTVTRLVASAIGEGNEREGSRIVRGAFVYAGIFGSFATVALFSLAGVLGDVVLGSKEAVSSLRILALSLMPSALTSVISGYFVGVKKSAYNAAVQVIGQIFRIAVTVALIISLHGGRTDAVRMLCIGATLTELVCFVISLVEFIIERSIRRIRSGGIMIRPVAGMALPLAFSAYIRSALLALEHNLIPKRLMSRGDSRDVALSSYGTLHGMALPLILYPMAPLSSFCSLLVPEFASDSAGGRRERMERVAAEALGMTLSYAVVCAVLIYFHSEELGYVIYNSYDAGKYIGILSLVIPIMYLDHVTDSILKGIGEHVFSMWVNIADAFLSVGLVFVLIPIFGIGGYAIVIVGMELFNFLLSYARLKKRIAFRIPVFRRVVIPAISSALAVTASKILIKVGGKAGGVPILFVKLTVTLCVLLAGWIILSRLSAIVRGHVERRKNCLHRRK